MLRSYVRKARDIAYSARLLGGFGPAKRSLTILTYHRVLPVNSIEWQTTEPGMRVDAQTFERHLVWARRHFTPIHLGDWLSKRRSSSTDTQRFIAITFDDGWQDNFVHAFPLLEQHAFPATVFLVADAIDQKIEFWPQKLARLYFDDAGRRLLSDDSSLWSGELSIPQRFFEYPATTERFSELVGRSKKVSDEQVESALQNILSMQSEGGGTAPQADRRHFMNWAEVECMAGSEWVQFGSHTLSHQRLDAVRDPDILHKEVAESHQLFSQKLGGKFNSVFCYPNGSMSQAAEAAVKQHYQGACTVGKGDNAYDCDRFRLRRIGMHEDISASRMAFHGTIARSSQHAKA